MSARVSARSDDVDMLDHTVTTEEAVRGLRDALDASLPPNCVRGDVDSLRAYAADWSWPAVNAEAAGMPQGRPDIVARPRDARDVQTIVRLAARHGVPLVPWGAGTGVQGASVATRGGLVVDLRGLDGIRVVNEQAMTATVEAGMICDRFEEALNQRGLTFPHYPASSWLSTVGGYVACRGSGVMSTRYGKIEDLVLSLEVVLPDGSLIETLPVPRHACGPDLAGLFIGSEGTLGVITAATVRIKPLPAARIFRALAFPDLAAGLEAGQRMMHDGLRPPVMRLYDAAAAHSLGRAVGVALDGPTTVLGFEGRRELVDVEAALAVEHALACGGRELEPAIGEAWWEHRFDFYYPPHYPTLPSIWGTIDVVATYDRIMPAYEAMRTALVDRFSQYDLRLTTHLSHWYDWGTMLYARIMIPHGPDDPAAAFALNEEIWQAGVEAALNAGAVINDHHGLGLKLTPFLKRQYGTAYPTLMAVKRALDPGNIMNPGKWLEDYTSDE